VESAMDIKTGQIVDGEQLWYLDSVDKDGYVCRGCSVKVNPVSFERTNKKRPHFKELPSHPHQPWCDVEGEQKLIAQGKKKRLTSNDGAFPGSFPSKLELIDERVCIDDSIISGNNHSRLDKSHHSSAVRGEVSVSRWTARTIRPICKTYMNFPLDRDLELAVPGAYGRSYDEVIRRLSARDIVQYTKQHIFFAPLAWKSCQVNEEHLVISLGYGFWANNKLEQSYRVLVDIKNLSEAKKNSIIKEIEISQEEAKQAKISSNKTKEKSWLFFYGKQLETQPTNFLVTDHRLICCLTGEI
jgi:hypothetical protein